MLVEERVRDWLKSSYNINVNDQWLAACIEFIQQETQSSLPNCDQLKQLVFEQWLTANLADIGLPVIPDEVFCTDKCILPLTYPLQMTSVIDVAVPLYSQIRKLQGEKEVNVNLISFSDNPFEFAASQSQSFANNNNKSSRLLKFELTDGHRSIQAIEYKPIRMLSADLLPGAKLLIQGSVLCRRQVLLLQEDNVSVLGGEVDDLVLTSDPVASLQAELEKNKRGIDVGD